MMQKALACTMFLGVVFSLPAAADDTNLNFKGGIGVIPVSSVTCMPSATPCVTGPTVTVTVNQNVVRGQQPAGQIWVIDELDAQVQDKREYHGSRKGVGSGRRQWCRRGTRRNERVRHPELSIHFALWPK